MPIDLRCSGCQNLIRVPDDGVGRQAKCPACGTLTTVVEGQADAGTGIPNDGTSVPNPGTPDGQAQNFAGVGSEFGSGSAAAGGGGSGPVNDGNPYGAAPQANPYAPASGIPNNMPPAGEIAHGTIDVSLALSDAWQAFQKNAGLMVGAFLLVMLFSIALSMALQGVMAVGAEIGGDNPFIMMSFWGVTQFGNQLVSAFLNIGMILLFLALVRGQAAGIHLLFGGMPYLVRGFVASLLFGVIIGVGLLLLVLPGIYLALRLWPFLYFIVDRDADIVESFSLSWEYSRGNELNGVLLFLLGIVLVFIGLVLCFFGLLVTMPISYALIAISYLMMTSQPYQRYIG